MKISVISVPEIAAGKRNIKDPRLDEVDKLVKAKKKTYIQVEIIGEAAAFEADALIVAADSGADLILKDLEFIETRLGRCANDQEKTLLTKLKGALEKEEFVSKCDLSPDEKKALAGSSLLTIRPVIAAQKEELENQDALLARAVKEGGFISFFTAGEKETRAWLIRKGTSAWEAAGVIHSDIQKGFIRAEIISFDDFIQCGGETQAKQAGKQRLETKEYIMQDCDLANFRFNK